jgi:methylphosphotriester-DNA--protein-cysteine methyltransferase
MNMKTMKTSSRTTQTPGNGKYATDNERWNALVHRDQKADGTFYYSVKTTGVYCRPSCAARLARRENVQFHASCGEAERAGFRSCKRCQPGGPALAEQHAAKVAAACRAVETAEELPSLDVLAKAAGMSRFHFHRVFKSVTGVTRTRNPVTLARRLTTIDFLSNGRLRVGLGLGWSKDEMDATGERLEMAANPDAAAGSNNSGRSKTSSALTRSSWTGSQSSVPPSTALHVVMDPTLPT